MDMWPIVDLPSLASDVKRLQASADSDAGRIHQLERRVTQLTLACAALWQLVKKTSDLSEVDLQAAIDHALATNANIPGDMSPRPLFCPACDHKLPPNSTRCLYCGAAIPQQNHVA